MAARSSSINGQPNSPLRESSHSPVMSWWKARRVEVSTFFSHTPKLFREEPHPIRHESLATRELAVLNEPSYEVIIVIPKPGERGVELDPISRAPLYQIIGPPPASST